MLCSISIPGVVSQVELPLGVSVAIDISQSFAHPGDNVTVTCRVQEHGGNPVYFFKTVHGHDTEELIDLISADTTKLPPYATFPRYVVEMAETGETTLFMLHIYSKSLILI